MVRLLLDEDIHKSAAAVGMMGREEEERRGPGTINPREIKKKVEVRVTFSVK